MKTNFEEISKLVAHNADLPLRVGMIDQCAYQTLKSLNFQYKNKMISKDSATKAKKELIREYTERKKYEDARKEEWGRQLENIRITQELRAKLNRASRDGNVSKELWLEAIECIDRLCGGSLADTKSCKKYLEETHEDG